MSVSHRRPRGLDVRPQHRPARSPPYRPRPGRPRPGDRPHRGVLDATAARHRGRRGGGRARPGGARPERGLPVLGRPGQRRGPPGARLGEGGPRRGGEDAAADLRAARGRLARVGRPGPGDPGRRAVRRPDEEDRRARGVQHPAPRLRPVLRGRREGRGHLPCLDRGVRGRRRGRPRHRDPGAGRPPPHRGPAAPRPSTTPSATSSSPRRWTPSRPSRTPRSTWTRATRTGSTSRPRWRSRCGRRASSGPTASP
ncbi:hypothetical protein SBADM41S_06410 [Streptomyces badius]